jgi:hypothetical protein
MAIAVWGALSDLSLSSFASWGMWLIGVDLLNDFVVLPVVALVCVGLARLPLGFVRAPVQAGLFASVMVLLVGGPGLAGTAAVSGNPTIQPIDYATSTLTALAVVWGAAVTWATVRWVRSGRPGWGGAREPD